MNDKAKCQNNECPKQQTCFRFVTPSSKPYQMYVDFKHDERGYCDYYDEVKQ
jgi:hypothetical protein